MNVTNLRQEFPVHTIPMDRAVGELALGAAVAVSIAAGAAMLVRKVAQSS